jgi:hypothetical protein
MMLGRCSPNICVYAYVVAGVGWLASLLLMFTQVGAQKRGALSSRAAA